MLEKIFQLLSIRCRHRRLSKPFAVAAPDAHSAAQPWQAVGSGAAHYVVCLECGQKFKYDWQNMRVVKRGA